MKVKKEKIFIKKYLFLFLFFISLISLSFIQSEENIINVNVEYNGFDKKIDDMDVILYFLFFHPGSIQCFLSTKYYGMIKDFYDENKEKINYLYDEYRKFVKNEYNVEIEKINIDDNLEYYNGFFNTYVQYLSIFINLINMNLNNPEFKYISIKNTLFLASGNTSYKFPDNFYESVFILNYLIYIKRNQKLDILDLKSLKKSLLSVNYSEQEIENIKNIIKTNFQKYIEIMQIPSKYLLIDIDKNYSKSFNIKFEISFILGLDSLYFIPDENRILISINKYQNDYFDFVLAKRYSTIFLFFYDYNYSIELKKRVKKELLADFLSNKIIINKNSHYNNLLKYYGYENQNLKLIDQIKSDNIFYYYYNISKYICAQIFYYSKYSKFYENKKDILLNEYIKYFFQAHPEFLKDPSLFYKNLEKTLETIHNFSITFLKITMMKIMKNNFIY